MDVTKTSINIILFIVDEETTIVDPKPSRKMNASKNKSNLTANQFVFSQKLRALEMIIIIILIIIIIIIPILIYRL